MQKTYEELKEQARLRQAKWRKNNLEKVRKQARDYVVRLKEKDLDAYKTKASQISKKSREKNIDKYKEKSREYTRKKRSIDPVAYNLAQKKYRDENKEKFHQYYEKRKESSKIGARIRLLKKYNLTPETYNEMLINQEGKCAICKIDFSESEKPNIDHCHEKGHVRALLCSPCNIVLGHVEKTIKNNPNVYNNFIEYLKIQSNPL